MASAAEQLAANLNFGAFAKADELKKRIWFTLGALLVYRLGTYIPLPGIDPNIWEQVFRSQAGGILGMFNMFAGGGIHRMAIFALNIMPYISASIIIQLLTTVSPQLEALKKEGESGRKLLNQYTRYLTVILAAFQSYGIAVGLEGAGNVVSDPGMFFRLSTAITLTGGTMFLMWLGEQITSRGIGNGISLIILAGIVAELPAALANMLELGRQGAMSTGLILVVIIMAVAVIAFIVFMERAQRRLLIQYPKRQVGNKMFEGQSSHLPLKLNTSGVIPPIFASSLLLLPTTVANFNAGSGPEWFQWITTQLGHGRPLFLIMYLALIVFFAFFYTAIVFNPTETADNLKKHGGFIPGIRPGERTAEYIDYVLSRVTVLGAVYLAIVCFDPGNPDLLRLGAVLFRRHLAADRRQRHHGHGGAGAGLSAGASVRRPDPEVEAARPPPLSAASSRAARLRPRFVARATRGACRDVQRAIRSHRKSGSPCSANTDLKGLLGVRPFAPL
ncbi:preprotein translocase subunit SecY [Bradyrhizobium sp. LB7.2]